MAQKTTNRVRRTGRGHKLDAIRDTLDFRDRMYVPTLIEVPTEMALEDYRQHAVPILDQGKEGACTGFGLATVANFLLRRRKRVPEEVCVSPRMLYEMAKRYDEWPGENYDGSSARGAMKGWNKHGVCVEAHWPYDEAKKDEAAFAERWTDAMRRPLGAYFRVNHTDIVAMHSAIAEVEVLYATGSVHKGWDRVGSDGLIEQSDVLTGGHAFAIVAYDQRGFWIQNSWGDDWGFKGFGQISYDDFLANATDVWVARLGAPVTLKDPRTTATGIRASSRGTRGYVFADLRPHIISLGNDGQPRTSGTYGTSAADIGTIFETDFPAVTKDWPRKFGRRRLLLYAHGGLVDEDAAVQMVAELREALLAAGIYPVSFLWQTDFWSTVKDILDDALRQRRPEGVLDATKDFMLDRLDDALEPLARGLGGRLAWSQMKQNALAATVSETGGARLAAGHIAKLMEEDPKLEIHLVAHSAGSTFLAGLAQLLTTNGAIADGPLAGSEGLGRIVTSCTLWAPACTMDLFNEMYAPSIAARTLKRFALFTLTDQTERADNCVDLYHKSLLYLVSDALETRARIPFIHDGEPLLGLAKDVEDNEDLVKKLGKNWVRSPNTMPAGSPYASTARHHTDFHSDPATLKATLARVLTDDPVAAKRAEKRKLVQHATQAGLRSRRETVERSG